MRGPSSFEVIERPSNESHGIYETLDEARGCVAFDRLADYEIWQGDHIVEEEFIDNSWMKTPRLFSRSRR